MTGVGAGALVANVAADAVTAGAAVGTGASGRGDAVASGAEGIVGVAIALAVGRNGIIAAVAVGEGTLVAVAAGSGVQAASMRMPANAQWRGLKAMPSELVWA